MFKNLGFNIYVSLDIIGFINCDRHCLGVGKKPIPFMCFDYVTIFHPKVNLPNLILRRSRILGLSGEEIS